MDQAEEGGLARRRAITASPKETGKVRARARQVKLDRYLEMRQIRVALVQQRREAGRAPLSLGSNWKCSRPTSWI
eukprot:7163001-Pyramimonas_sp.AAC.1